ncbi:MAG: hypothetical protein OXN97_21095 [Bryobacterales bacterium]|nr:hypothetical protein [Bryobacterales bacterium]MDE0628313.1 hypothetical protein [Bryobacterales bacterium]
MSPPTPGPGTQLAVRLELPQDRPTQAFLPGNLIDIQHGSYRRFLFSTVAPLGRLVAAELTAKLETPVTLEWGELRAGDISGRARAYHSLVGAGFDKDKEERVSGLTEG